MTFLAREATCRAQNGADVSPGPGFPRRSEQPFIEHQRGGQAHRSNAGVLEKLPSGLGQITLLQSIHPSAPRDRLIQIEQHVGHGEPLGQVPGLHARGTPTPSRRRPVAGPSLAGRARSSVRLAKRFISFPHLRRLGRAGEGHAEGKPIRSSRRAGLGSATIRAASARPSRHEPRRSTASMPVVACWCAAARPRKPHGPARQNSQSWRMGRLAATPRIRHGGNGSRRWRPRISARFARRDARCRPVAEGKPVGRAFDG
ncbi:MAG: hypothetical protein CM1200mP34_5100 [Verrucomicrobiales bacterium]|nr:MAG: hypothetical protein CM1200mP34_5100 [Verrucomicrobiales bacterium]